MKKKKDTAAAKKIRKNTVMPASAEEGTQLSMEEKQIRRRKRRRRRRRIFSCVFLTIVIGTAAFGVLTFVDKKGYVNVETIEVEGNTYYDTVAITEIAGSATGEGLIYLKTGKIRNQIEDMPYVKSAKISKRLPHTLRITIAERTARYAVYFGGFYLLLDDEYHILEKTNNAGELKIIEGFVPDTYDIGEKFVPQDQESFTLAVKLADAIKEKGLDIYKVAFRNDLMRIYFSKYIVCEGEYENLIKYIDELNEILYSLSTQGIERTTIYIGDNGYISRSPKIE